MNTKGSIALISILIITAVLMIITVSMAEVNISTGYNYLNNQSNTESYHIAESCLEESIVRLERDNTYTGGTITLGSSSCTSSISANLPNHTITISVTHGDYTQNYSASTYMLSQGGENNIDLLSWEEI